MGLPDISPTPKKDSMGMDYIPVYEGEDSDDGSVKLSPGKIQRTGVKSEPAARRVIRTTIRAPGTIQLDERRVSVIAMRAESYVQKVADVTTGAHVVKGQPLMEIYSPAISSAAAEYIATHQFEDHRRRRGAVRPRLAAAADESRRSGRSHRRHGEEPAPFRSRSNGRRRATASFSNATPSRACARSPATCCSGSPITRWSGRSSMSPSAISAASPSASA